MSPQAVLAKAEMLLAADRVTEVKARTFVIEGSEDRKYLTSMFGVGGGKCSCRSSYKCSHIRAAELRIEREAKELSRV